MHPNSVNCNHFTMGVRVWGFNDHMFAVKSDCLVSFYDRSVFHALFGAIYLCFGMSEVYRILFEAFGMDPEDESCQPKLRRQLEDVDFVSAEFEDKRLSWQEIAAYRASLVLM